jgi:hypothetical protein
MLDISLKIKKLEEIEKFYFLPYIEKVQADLVGWAFLA